MSVYTPSDQDVRYILAQAPEHVTEIQARSVLIETEGDMLRALEKLWNVFKQTPTRNDPIQAKWTEVRSICDAYDGEMEKYLKNMKGEGFK